MIYRWTIALCLASTLLASGQVEQAIEKVRDHYSASALASDETTRQKYIHDLVRLRAEVVDERPENMDWQAVDAEIIRHPAPANSDSETLSRALVGIWRSPRHDYEYLVDRISRMADPPVHARWPSYIPGDPIYNKYRASHTDREFYSLSQAKYPWCIRGNLLYDTWNPHSPAEGTTIILIDHEYFISAKGQAVFICKRMPNPAN